MKSPLTAAQLAKEEGNEVSILLTLLNSSSSDLERFNKLSMLTQGEVRFTFVISRALGLCKEAEANEKVNIYNNRAQCYVQLVSFARY